MDILLIDPPYISLKGVASDRGYNVGLTGLAAYLDRAGISTGVLYGDLLEPPASGSILFNFDVNRYAEGQREYERTLEDRTHPIWYKIADAVRQANPTAVGLAHLTPSKYVVEKTAALIKEIDPRIRIIAGSFHPTFCPDEVLRNDNIDFIVRGEGEIPLLRLMEELKKPGPDWETVPGISYRDADGQVHNNPAPPLIEDLDELPFPARDLVLNRDYDKYRAHCIATTRGCPYSCAFCADRRLWGNRVRRRSVANVLAELRLLRDRYPVNFVDIFDGTFTYDRKYLQQFCEAIIDEKLDINWRCTARYDNLDPDILKLMRRAHCTGMFVGLESGSNRILDGIDKKFHVDKILQVSKMIRKSGIPCATSILLGLPDEGREDIAETLELMKTVKTDILDVNVYTPLPGTPLYDAMSEEDRQKIDWHKVALKSFDNYFSRKMSAEEFGGYRQEAYRIANSVRKKTVLRWGVRAVFRPFARLFRKLAPGR
ncbi:MAG: radical SAM protein [Chloroflexota bacterium]